MGKVQRHLVTAALPYANGPLHIGHLAGVYIPADIYVRYKRLKGDDVLFVSGSDEHGVPITIKAKNEGITPQDVVDRYHVINKKAFEDLGIDFSIYSRTSSPTHHKTSSEYFKTLYNKGVFEEKVTKQYYDEQSKQFLADRYIMGTCPHCSNDKAYGDQCENCGTSLTPLDLKDVRSTISGNQPILKETKHWYLPLEKYTDFLDKWILEDHKEWKSNVYGQCKSWIRDIGLESRAVTRDLDWGVPVPVEGAEGKVLYVWFDAPIGYISNSIEWSEKTGNDWKPYWQSEDTNMVHFIGKDNIVFHCIIFPAMLKSHGDFILPTNVPANEFLNLENDKISTSRNWAVWLHEYLEDFPDKQDTLRYALTANMPEAKDNDFTWKDFQNRNNNELVAIYGNFVNRSLVLTNKYFEGKVPPRNTVTSDDQETLDELQTIKAKIESNLDQFKFREALKDAMSLARLGNKYLADTEPWKLFKTDPERVQTVLNIALQLAANLTIITEPFLPFSAEKLRGFMNISSLGWDNLGKDDLINAGHELNKPSLLFEKIEDEAIEKQLQKLEATKKANQAEESMEPQKDTISFDDFTKMDVRVGTILEAIKVPKTKKLMQLLVDTGVDQRTIVSGIAEFYEPDQVIGKQVSILLNLAPRKIKGIESQGMILMAENQDGSLSFVSPEKEITNGGTVR